MEHLIDNKPDVIFLTETWLTTEKNNITTERNEYGYEPLHKIKKNLEKDRGGGIEILKIKITGKQLVIKDYYSFEYNVVTSLQESVENWQQNDPNNGVQTPISTSS